MSSSTDPNVTGLYGKLPALGDFIARRLPTYFVDPWDRWLQESLAASQAQIGEGWLDTYLTSPLWRFALSPGIAGQSGWAGVLMPSVDRVGRYFPLTLACPLPSGANPLRVLCAHDWYAQAEAAALAGLEEGIDAEGLDARVAGLGAPLAADTAAPPDTRSPPGTEAWQMLVPTPAGIADAYPVLLARALEELFFAYSLWWSAGSDRVAPSLLACQGLPAPAAFAALLAGDWGGRGWVSLGSAP